MRDNTQFNNRVLQGIPASQGIAVGQLWISDNEFDFNLIEDVFIPQTHRAAEKEHFLKVLEQTHNDIINLKNKYSPTSLPDVYIAILQSPLLHDKVLTLIEAGHCLSFALKKTIQKYIGDFEKLDNAYLESKKLDLLDLGKRILMHVQPKSNFKKSKAGAAEKIILMTHDLSIASLADIPKGSLKGIISSEGSLSSHIAILAKAMGIPAVMGIRDWPKDISDLTDILINGTTGEVTLFPTREMINQAQDLIETSKKVYSLTEPSIEKAPIILQANTDVCSDIEQAIALGAQGVGLYRSEVAFMMHDHFPSEVVQQKIYQEVLTCFAPHPVSIRVLDVGADKPLPYFSPSLDLRGIRILLAHPDIFLSQLRAMLRASQGVNNLKILLPMIADTSDVEQCITLINKAYEEVSEQTNIVYPEIGAMIEIPCAIFQIESIIERVDFVSVGSNDLIQYLLAVDRGNSQSTPFYDCLHPAVLKALDMAVQSAHRHNKKISICGEMASSAMSAVVLLGLDFDILSMQAQNLPIIRSVLAHFTRDQARALVKELLKMEDVRDIHGHLENALSQSGWVL